jgi:hypothetical protein
MKFEFCLPTRAQVVPAVPEWFHEINGIASAWSATVTQLEVFKMRATLLFLFCIVSGAAQAQGTDCKSMPNAKERLACYDQAAPPAAKSKAKSSTGAAAPDQKGKVVDELAIENDRVNAKTKSICRGC